MAMPPQTGDSTIGVSGANSKISRMKKICNTNCCKNHKMNLRKTILAPALILCMSGLSLFRINAQQVASIPHVNSKVVVDGYADEVWNSLEEHPITFLIDGVGYPSVSDCSGNYKAFWNRDTLYVLIFAEDNKLFTADPTVYYNDGFEIYLNVDNTKDTVYTKDCYQFRFIPGSTDITGRWGLNVWTPPAVDFAIHVDADTNRTIEAVFPLTALGKNSPVADGDSMGFEIEILDNDGSGRNHVLSWNKNLHMAWYNPTHMGTIIYSDNTVTSVKNWESSDFSVYPNPVTDKVLIQSADQFNDVSIYSAQGQLMYDQVGFSGTSLSIDMDKFKPGMYILNVTMNNGTRVNYKLVKSSTE
jgi:hypothetical protein